MKNFTILDAINVSAEAWNNISAKTITKCWIKTKILSQANNLLTENITTEQASNEVIAEEKKNEEELDQLLTNMENNRQVEDLLTAAGILFFITNLINLYLY